MEKLPPHSSEAERGVISSVFYNSESLVEIADLLRPEDFYHEKNRLVYRAMLALDAQHTEIDHVTISDELERENKLDAIGGAFELQQMANFELNASNIVDYAQRVRHCSQLRAAVRLASEIVQNAYERDPETIAKAEQAFCRLAQGQAITRVHNINDVLDEFEDDLEQVIANHKQGKVSGVPTNFSELDKILGGLQPSDLIVLAARPAVGKTSLCLNIAYQVMGNALKTGRNVLMFSLEMGEKQLMRRLVSMDSGVDQTKLRTGDVTPDEYELVKHSFKMLRTGRMWIDDTPAISTAAMRSRARRMQAEQGLDLIIVDYMQLMRGLQDNGKPAENRVQEVSKISRDLKELARELDVPLLSLAQLSRAAEHDKVPQLSHLRESGSIEQDSDVVMFIHQDDDLPVTPKGPILNIIVEKHRNGPIGTAQLLFNPTLTRFYNLEDA